MNVTRMGCDGIAYYPNDDPRYGYIYIGWGVSRLADRAFSHCNTNNLQ